MPRATLRGLAIWISRLRSLHEDDRGALPISRRSTATQSPLSGWSPRAVDYSTLSGDANPDSQHMRVRVTVEPDLAVTRLPWREPLWRAGVDVASAWHRCEACSSSQLLYLVTGKTFLSSPGLIFFVSTRPLIYFFESLNRCNKLQRQPFEVHVFQKSQKLTLLMVDVSSEFDFKMITSIFR